MGYHHPPYGCEVCGKPKAPGRGKHYCDKCRPTKQEATRLRMQTYKWRHPERTLVIYARASASDKGLSCNLKFGDLVVPKKCPVLGIPLFFTKGKRTWNTPTVDRINSRRGYTRNNVVVVSWRANALKSDATLQELQQIAKFYRRYA